MLNIFIGYDSREPAAFSVLASSILRRASRPVAIIPLVRDTLHREHSRPPSGSTEFSLTRFLAPYLSDYQGYSVFMDCDMLCQADIADLLLYPMAYPDHAVFVCQHNYTPKDATKFEGNVQQAYPRKNWSSLMVFNNAKCRALTAEYVNTASPLELHQFKWVRDEQIGMLPLNWNWLVGEYHPNPTAKILHYTLGGPWFAGYEQSDHADAWRAELHHMRTRC